MKIVIAGLSKSGTTALFFKIKNSLVERHVDVFEPKENKKEFGEKNVLVKILIDRIKDSTLDIGSFDDFDKKIIIVRDPRDQIISSFLYNIRHTEIYKDDRKLEILVDKLKEKEKNPELFSALDFFKILYSLEGKKFNENDFFQTSKFFCNQGIDFSENHKDYFILKYEDLIDENVEELEKYLGFELLGSSIVSPELKRVERTKNYGDWKNWFSKMDVELFKNIFSEYLKFFNYKDDWQTNKEKIIKPEYCHLYVRGIAREKIIEDTVTQKDVQYATINKEKKYQEDRLSTIISERNGLLEEKTQRIKDKDFEINRLSGLISEKSNLLEEKTQRIKDLSLSLQDEKSHAEIIFKSLNDAHIQKEEKQKEINNLIISKNKDIFTLKSTKEREIIQLKETILQEEIYIKNLERSLTFKLLKTYQKFINFILPERFFLRRFYDRLIYLNQAFINKDYKKKEEIYPLYKKGEGEANPIGKADSSKPVLDKPKKSDILFINHEETKTGAPRIIFEIAKYFKSRYKIELLSKRKGSMHEEFANNFENIIYPDELYPNINKFEKARKILEKVRPELVYANTLASYEYAFEAKRLGITAVLHIHELDSAFQVFLTGRERIDFHNYADIFIANSEAVSDYLINRMYCSREKVKLIHGFVDVEKVIELSKEKVPEVLKNEGETLIVMVGTFCRRKGPDILSEAVNKLNTSGYNCRVIWIGPEFEKSYSVVNEIQNRSGKFVFLGLKENPFPYIKQADVFVLSSREEPFGIVVTEAMALGKPIISFRENTDAKELIDQNNGIIVDKTDPDSLANAIKNFIRNADEFKEKAEKFSPQKIRDNYDTSVVMPKFVNLINEWMGKKTASEDFLNKLKSPDILFIGHEEYVTGATKIIFEIAKYFKSRYKIELLSKRKGSMHEEFANNFENIIYPDELYPNINKFEKARKILEKVRPRLVYTSCIVSYEYALQAKKLGIPTIFHVHELDMSFQCVMNSQERIDFHNYADFFIADSMAVSDYLINKMNCPKDKIRLIHEFVDVEKVIELSKEKVPEVLKNEGETLIVMVGTFVHRKAPDILCEATDLLNEGGYNCRTVWIGEEIDSHYRVADRIQNRSGKFVFLGLKENPFPYIKQADVFVLSSREEPFGIVVTEAMALGKPIISFRENTDAKELIDQNNGIIVDKTDPDSLANAIKNFIRNADEFKEKAEKFSPQKIRDNYDTSVVMPKFVNLINEWMGKINQNKNPEINKVSVIIPSYNYGWCIGEAIESVINQTYKNWELLIIDDFSSDNSLDVVNGYIKKYPKKIRLIEKDIKDKGIAGSYKTAIKSATGGYVAFLEADDIWEDDSIQVRVNILETNVEPVLVYNGVKLFGSDEKTLENKKIAQENHFKGIFIPENKFFDAYHFFTYRCIVPTLSSVLVRRVALINLDFSDKFGAWFDWWLYAQISKKGYFYYLPLEKTFWRIHDKSFNHRFLLEENVEERNMIIKKDIVKLGFNETPSQEMALPINSKETKVNNSEEFIYFFYHMPKCAGSVLTTNIKGSLDKDEYLEVYFGKEGFESYGELEDFLWSLPKSKKDKIKIVFGHNVFWGMHKFFDKKPRYVTFLRDPNGRTISHYNFCRTDYEHFGSNAVTPIINDEGGKILDFEGWVRKNTIMDNLMTKIFLDEFLGRRGKPSLPINVNSIKKLKEILKSFYILGTVENFERDSALLYKELGLKKIVERINASKNFVDQENEEVVKFLEEINKIDKEIYDFSYDLSKKNRS